MRLLARHFPWLLAALYLACGAAVYAAHVTEDPSECMDACAADDEIDAHRCPELCGEDR